jgi:hypothetical protein
VISKAATDFPEWMPNAMLQARLEAGATEERTL